MHSSPSTTDANSRLALCEHTTFVKVIERFEYSPDTNFVDDSSNDIDPHDEPTDAKNNYGDVVYCLKKG